MIGVYSTCRLRTLSHEVARKILTRLNKTAKPQQFVLYDLSRSQVLSSFVCVSGNLVLFLHVCTERYLEKVTKE